MGVAEELIERARTGAPAGECAIAVEGGTLRLAVLLRPAVPMSHYMGILPVCALGALEGLRPLRDDLALAWPGNVVVPDEDGHATQVACALGVRAGTGEGGHVTHAACTLDVHAGTGEAGMFAVCSANVLLGWFEGASADALTHGVCTSIVSRVDAWAADVSVGRGAAGPVAPVLSDYFDALALMGRSCEVVYPNGRVAAAGTLTAVDVWGRATVRLADGRELVVSPEQASLR